jgi:hypothetical protein
VTSFVTSTPCGPLLDASTSNVHDHTIRHSTLATILAPVVSVSGQQSGSIENFSERARNVTFVTLLEAQQRGTDTIDDNDLIIALVIEHQDWDAVALFDIRPPGGVPLVTAQEPFLPPKAAVDVLVKMNVGGLGLS